ncbi:MULTISPECIES: hypothetical protein [unclassified Mesorhizobium]|uniref:hypothetical protein n=3 Tax=Mesorhizobium TaxID=68287 RepID=UPI000FC9F50E|nr:MULTISPECIES: hypothetical protein [unclassified Mesorhizobium]RUT87469.1 hypothetical protein EOD14_10185 [Mesorhizobium sp. M7A.T.Ca.US.000.02.1.1]RUT90866.1 hypothetical protein EOD15_17085 [Mesorhizobium sp. M7A.T.Ca.US.000.02.2.1]
MQLMDAKCTVKPVVLKTYTFLDAASPERPCRFSDGSLFRPGTSGVAFMSIGEMKRAILKKRRQRVRRSTYGYVAELMLADTAFSHPFRNRMIIDWWARVIDPLEAETFDRGPKGRLKYFRDRLREHLKAPSINAAARQGDVSARQLRRLGAEKLAYVQQQVRRLSDRRLNYVAAEAAFDANDDLYVQMTVGLIALPTFRPGREGGLLDGSARRASNDPRFLPLVSRIRETPDIILPGYAEQDIARRIEQLSNPYDPVWLFERTYVSERKREGLIRKLEEEYLSKI